MKLVVYSSHREAVSCSHARITGNLQLSGLIGTASHQDMQEIRIIVFFLNTLHWQIEFLLLFTLYSCV